MNKKIHKHQQMITSSVWEFTEDCTIVDFTKAKPNYINMKLDGLVNITFDKGDQITLLSGRDKKRDYSSFDMRGGIYKADSKYGKIHYSYPDIKDKITLKKPGIVPLYYIYDKSTDEFIHYSNIGLYNPFKPISTDQQRTKNKDEAGFSYNLHNIKKIILASAGYEVNYHHVVFVPPYFSYENLEVRAYDKLTGDYLKTYDIYDYVDRTVKLNGIKTKYGLAVKEMVRRILELNETFETIISINNLTFEEIWEIEKICKDMKLKKNHVITRRSGRNLCIGFKDNENAIWFNIMFKAPSAKYYKFETIMESYK